MPALNSKAASSSRIQSRTLWTLSLLTQDKNAESADVHPYNCRDLNPRSLFSGSPKLQGVLDCAFSVMKLLSAVT